MPVHKKEHTTPATDPSVEESSAPNLPSQEDFHLYLRAHIREATRVVMEEIMKKN
jgi:hypothetical protein